MTTTASPPATTESATTTSTTYRPHLDGLRAVAVYLVVLFHAGSARFSGGYIGVDVFFVLSGFLVTQLLLRDIQGRGSIGFTRFYSRRFRRLLPAAFVVLVVTAVVYSAIASPSEALDAVGSFKAAFLYSTNWYFIHQSTAYFGASIDTNPVLHFWSLAVEEQFYLLWPLLLGGAFAVTRRFDRPKQIRTIRIAVAVGALASAVWAMSLRSASPERAYYGTDARAYELLAGALLALAPAFIASAARFPRLLRAATLVGIAAVIGLATSWVHLDAIERGIAVTIVTCILLAALETTSRDVVQRALSTRSMVYLGRISYGTYLWHWIIILVIAKELHLSERSTIAIACLLATALASLSYDLMERPVRTSERLDRHRRVIIALGLVVSVVGALVIVPAILGNPRTETASPGSGGSIASAMPVPAGLDWKAVKHASFKTPDCLGKPATDCVIVHGTGPTVDLIGDSHAGMLTPTLTDIAERRHWTLAINEASSCPWQDGLYRFGPRTKAHCLSRKEDWARRVIPALDPRIVFLAGAPLDKPGVRGLDLSGPHGELKMGSKAAERAIESATDTTVARLRREGRDVVLIEPIPQAPQGFDPLACISKAKVLDECRFIASAVPSALARHYRGLDRADDHVWSLDLNHLICPYLPICDPVVNGQIVWFDLSHISRNFAQTLAGPVAAYLKDNGVGAR